MRTPISKVSWLVFYRRLWHRPVTFCKEVEAVFLDAQSAVGRIMSDAKSVFLAVDGWEDARHLTVLGITALPPGKKPLLVAFDRVEERESSAGGRISVSGDEPTTTQLLQEFSHMQRERSNVSSC